MSMDGHLEDILNRRWQPTGNFNKQVAAVLQTIRMTPQQVNSLHTLYYDVEQTLSRIWPVCQVEPFGSVLANLALKNSDVDCFVKLPADCEDKPETCVEKCRDVIADGASPFRVASITMKKVPIVQLVHTQTGRNCELSFNKPIAVEFNKFVRHLLASDHRALKLAMLIKCWAKIQNITGSKRLPSNALIILIIFFLQLKKILPPVATLQKNVSPNMIEGWNTAFTETAYESRYDRSVYNLLREFFVCYEQFDFRNLVVCPYLGYELERRQFQTVAGAPSDFHLYKKNVDVGACKMIFLNCILCIQDPFEHARNVAGPVRPQVAGEILQLFKGAASVCASTSQHAVLNKLFSYQYTELIARELPQRGHLRWDGSRGRRPTYRSQRWAQGRPYQKYRQ